MTTLVSFVFGVFSMGALTLNSPEGFIGVVMFLIAVGSFVITLIWLRIGWRAMKAHVRLSDAVESMARGPNSSSSKWRKDS